MTVVDEALDRAAVRPVVVEGEGTSRISEKDQCQPRAGEAREGDYRPRNRFANAQG